MTRLTIYVWPLRRRWGESKQTARLYLRSARRLGDVHSRFIRWFLDSGDCHNAAVGRVAEVACSGGWLAGWRRIESQSITYQEMVGQVLQLSISRKCETSSSCASTSRWRTMGGCRKITAMGGGSGVTLKVEHTNTVQLAAFQPLPDAKKEAEAENQGGCFLSSSHLPTYLLRPALRRSSTPSSTDKSILRRSSSSTPRSNKPCSLPI
jgi:hypothetical protein